MVGGGVDFGDVEGRGGIFCFCLGRGWAIVVGYWKGSVESSGMDSGGGAGHGGGGWGLGGYCLLGCGVKRPLVSVIVGVYNKEGVIGECLRSIFAQTFSGFEVIVVDDGSTDGSLEVVRGFQDGRLRVIVRERNSGLPGVPRNQAVREARGEYVAFLDADDRWMPEKLEKQLGYMRLHPEYLLTHTRCFVVDGEGKRLGLRHGGIYPADGYCTRELLRHCFITLSTVILTRELFEAAGGFSEEGTMRCGEDWEFFLRCSRRAAFGMPGGVLGCYRVWGESVSHEGANWRDCPVDFLRQRLWLSRRDLWGGICSRGEIRRWAWEAGREGAYYWRKRHEFGKGGWFAWQMFKLAPFYFGTWRQCLAVILRRP